MPTALPISNYLSYHKVILIQTKIRRISVRCGKAGKRYLKKILFFHLDLLFPWFFLLQNFVYVLALLV